MDPSKNKLTGRKFVIGLVSWLPIRMARFIPFDLKFSQYNKQNEINPILEIKASLWV